LTEAFSIAARAVSSSSPCFLDKLLRRRALHEGIGGGGAVRRRPDAVGVDIGSHHVQAAAGHKAGGGDDAE
jgi:hypothetical protein